MRIDSSGNVGIGTSSPSQSLVISSSSAGQTLVNIINTSSNYSWNIGVVGSSAGLAAAGNLVIRDSTNGDNILTMQGVNRTIALQGATSQTGVGITFPATQNASSNANTLDDYEEGTWTPTGIGQTFASATGKYTKIGRVVYISFDLTWSVTGAGNQAGFSGFPFASDGSSFTYSRGTSGYSGSIVMTSPGYAGTASGVLLYSFGNPPILDSGMSGLTLAGEGFYFV
jgi:hypothetical protein